MAEIASFGVNVDQNTRLAQNAQDTANTANGGVNNINDPNKLAPAEKATLKRKYDTDVLLYGMDTKKLTDNQLSTSEIDSAMNALTAYMTPFFANMTSTDTVDRDTLNTVYKNFDTADKDSDSAFTNMVSNTASDALSAGNQAKKAGSEAVVAGNQASEAANNAAAQASVAVSKANVAQSSVATAITKAGFANDTASTASQAANDAKTIASQAANNVAIAKNDAANALTSAASAAGQAGTALSNANTAMSSAANVLDTVSKLSVGENLYLQSTESTGYGTGAGTVVAASVPANEHISDYIAVDSTQPYVLQDWVTVPVGGQSWYAINFYDKNKASISRDAWGYDVFTASRASYSVTKFNKAGGTVIPANTAYVRISFRKYTDGKVSFTKGSVVPGYAPNPQDIQQQFTDINGQLSSKVSKDTYDVLADTVSENSTLSKQNQNALVNKADSQTVNLLTKRVSTAENTLTQTATKTALEQTKTDVDNINKTVQTNTSNITAQAGKIDGLLSSTTDINGKLTTLQGSFDLSSQQLSTTMSKVDDQTTSINDLQADSSGFKTQFQTVNDNVGKNATDIGTLQASSKELTTGFNTLTADNGTNKNDISQLKQTSKEVNSTLETVQTQVNNSAVGTNLLMGTSAPASITGTNSSNQRVRSYALAGGMSAYNLYQKYGSTFTLSYDWSVTDTANTYAGTMRQQFNNVPWGIGDNSTISSSNKSGHKVITLTLANNSANIATGLESRLDNVPTTSKITISSMKLEKGSVATDWCPNPADNATVTALMQVKQTAKGASQLSKDNHGNILALQSTAKGLQTSVSNAATKDQLDILSDTFSNKISSATSAANSKMIQTINNVGIGFKNPDGSKFQMNLSADGTALMDFSKIMLNGQTNIQAATIGNAQIANGAITNAKIANLAVGTAQIGDGAITNAKIGNVDAGKITTGILDASHLNVDDVIANVINGKTITGITINTPTLNLGDNGILTGTYSVADSTSYFQPINGTGKLDISHGYIQSTANLIYYNKIMRGMANSWGYWKDSVTFVPEAHLTIGNTAESTLTAGFLKLDIFDQAKTHVVSRAYVDGTGLYINSGGTEAVSSMLSDFELLSSGRAYLMGGVNVPKSEIITIGNLQINGNHTIASNDGRDVYFKKASPKGSAPVGIHAKSFTKYSQLSIKTDISDLPADEATRMLNSIDVEKYRYTSDDATYKYQYGAIIDDINELGNKQYSLPAELLSEDGTGINMDSMTGILIKTVQDQNKKIGELSMRLTRLETA